MTGLGMQVPAESARLITDGGRGSRGRSAAGWVLVAALAYAPWALGCVPPWAIRGLDLCLGAALSLWAWDLVRQRRAPGTPLACLLCVCVLVFQGALLCFNARSRYDPLLQRLVPVRNGWAGAPGAVDAAAAGSVSARLGLLLGVVCLVCELAREPRWRGQLWRAMACVGVSVATYGLLQKAGLLPRLARGSTYAASSFASFDYHGNAGAFLNLVLPAVAGWCLVADRSEKRKGARGGWRAAPAVGPALRQGALVLCLVAAFVNVSKAGMAVTALLAAAFCAWVARARCRTARAPAPPSRRWSLIVVTVLLTAMLTAAIGGTVAWKRWSELLPTLHRDNARLVLWRTCLPMVRQAGMWGSGPGSFQILLPARPPSLLRDLYPRWIVTPYTPGGEVSIWSSADNDLLQTLIEWGWAGTGVWAALVLGGLARLAAGCRRKRAVAGDEDRVLRFVTAAALGGVFVHALVDSPLQIASLELYVAVYLGLAWSSPGWMPAMPALVPVAAWDGEGRKRSSMESRRSVERPFAISPFVVRHWFVILASTFGLSRRPGALGACSRTRI